MNPLVLGIDVTPLAYVPGAKIERYIGSYNFFFIRETSSVKEVCLQDNNLIIIVEKETLFHMWAIIFCLYPITFYCQYGNYTFAVLLIIN